MNADEQLVADRCEELLAEHDPAKSKPAEVLGAQYDAGLAWVHFPEGYGGLGLSPKLQTSSTPSSPPPARRCPTAATPSGTACARRRS